MAYRYLTLSCVSFILFTSWISCKSGCLTFDLGDKDCYNLSRCDNHYILSALLVGLRIFWLYSLQHGKNSPYSIGSYRKKNS